MSTSEKTSRRFCESLTAQNKLGFIMIKGDFTQRFMKNDPSLIPGNPDSENKINKWLSDSFEDYSEKVFGQSVSVIQTKLVKGLTEKQLVELYGDSHRQWLNSLNVDDHKKQMSVYDGTMGPIILALVKVDLARNTDEAEEILLKIRNTFRQDWHSFLNKEEILLLGKSKLFLSAMHVGNYKNDKSLLDKLGLIYFTGNK